MKVDNNNENVVDNSHNDDINDDDDINGDNDDDDINGDNDDGDINGDNHTIALISDPNLIVFFRLKFIFLGPFQFRQSARTAENLSSQSDEFLLIATDNDDVTDDDVNDDVNDDDVNDAADAANADKSPYRLQTEFHARFIFGDNKKDFFSPLATFFFYFYGIEKSVT